ncbi:MAG TPA: AzlD domain-containing protein [Acidimicrobiales bacterium]
MSAWLVVVAAGLGSYLFRISMVVLVERRGTNARFAHVSTFVVPAAFAALATGGIVAATTGVPVAGAVPPLAAVAVAAAAARRTGSAHAAILAGMPTLWVLSALLPA